MCTPIAATALTGLSAGFQAFAGMQAGQATQAADQYQAKSDLTQALSVNTAARANEQQTYFEGDQLRSRAVAAQGANGVNVNSGTALATQQDIANKTQRNVADQTYNASLATWGGLTQGSLLKAEGDQAITAGQIGVGTSLIGGASQVASKWAAYQGGA
jgi:hypothetical protein